MYRSIPISEEDIHEAFAILRSFIEVTKTRDDMDDRVDALMLHCQDLNIDEDLYAYITAHCLDQFKGETSAAVGVVGVICGLRIADCALLRTEDGVEEDNGTWELG